MNQKHRNLARDRVNKFVPDFPCYVATKAADFQFQYIFSFTSFDSEVCAVLISLQKFGFG